MSDKLTHFAAFFALLVCTVLCGCAVIYQGEDGQRRRVGLVWDTLPGERDTAGYHLDYQVVGCWIDLTSASGGFGVGYRSARVVDIAGDACIIVGQRAEPFIPRADVD